MQKKYIAALFAAALVFSAANPPGHSVLNTAIAVGAQAEESSSETPNDTALCSGDYSFVILEDGSLKVKYVGDKTVTQITLPETLENKKVTSLSENAFSGCEKLESVYLPESIADIGAKTFSGCESLKSVTVTNQNAVMDLQAFEKENIKLIGKHNSSAEKFAKENNFEFEYSDEHTYSETVVAPTYFSEGYTIYTCKDCGKTYTGNTVPALKLGQVQEFNADCTENYIKLNWLPVPDADGYLVYRYDNDSGS